MTTELRTASRRRARSDLDPETRLTDDHHESLRLWLRLLTCSNLIESQVRKRLTAQFRTTLPRFDLMAQLERAPHGLKMSELSRRLLVTGGNVTGVTDQLERFGLVVRAEDPDDRRAYRVRLTAEGKRVFAQMAKEHERWIVELFEPMGSREKRELAAMLLRLRVLLRGGGDA